ncbi:hypothetical protein E4T39_06090 [Aureobasidium subglaciale]|nr:hypothetical protein E4T39_06090 [Aureobasidium subglaciale]
MTCPFDPYLSTISTAHFCDNFTSLLLLAKQLFTLLVGHQDGTNEMPSASRAVNEHLRYGNAPRSSCSGTWNSKCQCRVFGVSGKREKACKSPIISLFISVIVASSSSRDFS